MCVAGGYETASTATMLPGLVTCAYPIYRNAALKSIRESPHLVGGFPMLLRESPKDWKGIQLPSAIRITADLSFWNFLICFSFASGYADCALCPTELHRIKYNH
jgi:hypothetical protein